MDGECGAICIFGTVSTVVEHGSDHLFDRCCAHGFRLVLPQLSSPHDRRETIYGDAVDVEICFGMFFRYFVVCGPKRLCVVVLLHIDAEVCTLLISDRVTRPSFRPIRRELPSPTGSRYRRDRLFGLVTLPPLTTSTYNPLLSP
jgi:hypothetical protein